MNDRTGTLAINAFLISCWVALVFVGVYFVWKW